MKGLTRLALFCLLLISATTQAAFKLPKYETYTLDNGLTVFLMPQSEVPLVQVQVISRAGSIDDGTQSGLASLTSESLKFGAGSRSKQQIDELFDSFGAELNVYAEKEYSGMALSFAKGDEKQLMPVLADMIVLPQFDKDEFDKFKTRYLAQLQQMRESPRNVIQSAFDRLYYGDHVYANPVEGQSESVKNIDVSDVRAFWAQHWVANNSALIVSGDIDVASWKKFIQRNFSGWKSAPVAQTKLAKFTPPSKPMVWVIDKPDAIETTFIIGGTGVSAKHPERVSLNVINTILGGRFTSWLNDELRVNSGLTYGARSGFDSYSQAGTFKISTFTKKETTFEAIDLALKTYQRIWDKGIDDATLKSAKAYVKGRFPTRYETAAQLGGFLARMWALGLSDDYINQFEAKVDALDVDKANTLARSVLPREPLLMVLIGDASLIAEKAKKYGEVKVDKIETVKF